MLCISGTFAKTKKDHSFRKRHTENGMPFLLEPDLVLLAPPQTWLLPKKSMKNGDWYVVVDALRSPTIRYFFLQLGRLPSGKGSSPPVAEAEAAAAEAAPKAEASAWQALNRRDITAKNNRLLKLVNRWLLPQLAARRSGQFVVVLMMKGWCSSSSTTISLLAVFLGEIAAWRIGFKLLPDSAGGRNDLWWTACCRTVHSHTSPCCCCRCLGADPDGGDTSLHAVDIVVDVFTRPLATNKLSTSILAKDHLPFLWGQVSALILNSLHKSLLQVSLFQSLGEKYSLVSLVATMFRSLLYWQIFGEIATQSALSVKRWLKLKIKEEQNKRKQKFRLLCTHHRQIGTEPTNKRANRHSKCDKATRIQFCYGFLWIDQRETIVYTAPSTVLTPQYVLAKWREHVAFSQPLFSIF